MISLEGASFDVYHGGEGCIARKYKTRRNRKGRSNGVLLRGFQDHAYPLRMENWWCRGIKSLKATRTCLKVTNLSLTFPLKEMEVWLERSIVFLTPRECHNQGYAMTHSRILAQGTNLEPHGRRVTSTRDLWSWAPSLMRQKTTLTSLAMGSTSISLLYYVSLSHQSTQHSIWS